MLTLDSLFPLYVVTQLLNSTYKDPESAEDTV